MNTSTCVWVDGGEKKETECVCVEGGIDVLTWMLKALFCSYINGY